MRLRNVMLSGKGRFAFETFWEVEAPLRSAYSRRAVPGILTGMMLLTRNTFRSLSGTAKLGVFRLGPAPSLNMTAGISVAKNAGLSARTGVNSLPIRNKEDGRARQLFSDPAVLLPQGQAAQDNALLRDESLHAAARQLHHLPQLLVIERVLLGGSLDLHNPLGSGEHEIHVHLGA